MGTLQFVYGRNIHADTRLSRTCQWPIFPTIFIVFELLGLFYSIKFVYRLTHPTLTFFTHDAKFNDIVSALFFEFLFIFSGGYICANRVRVTRVTNKLNICD